MIQWQRFFSGEAYKGTRNYLDAQRVYELLKTILLFAVSGSLFLAGYLQTGSRMNLLTIVAVLGCLPASKSLVIFIMFCRYKSFSGEIADRIHQGAGELSELYDMVFTGGEHTFPMAHMVVKGDTVCGFSQGKEFDEKAFEKHITPILNADGLTNVSVKIFTDLDKYLTRLMQLRQLSCDEKNTNAIINTLKSVCL